MSLLINADIYLEAEKHLNVHLRSDTAAKHALTFFNSTLLDAIALYDRPDVSGDDSQDLHTDINVHTHSAYSMDASCTQFEQQAKLNRFLGNGNYADFALFNALYQAPLAAKNAPDTIPQEVIDNLPWPARNALQPAHNDMANQPADTKTTPSPSSVLDTLTASQALSHTLG